MSALVCFILLFAGSVSAQETTTTQSQSLSPEELAEQEEEEARDELPDSFPRVSYGVGVELEDDYTFSATDEDAEFNNLFPTVEGEFGLEFWEGTGFFSTVVLEQVIDPEDDSAFQDVGLYAEELFGAISYDAFEFKGGKFNPAFGAAFDTAPGIFGTSFAEDYELTEQIGGGIGYEFEALGGEHVLSGAFFFADRTVLSNSAFTDRGRLRLDDGGVANTSAPKSFTIASDGEFDALSYTVGFRYLAAGEDTPHDEIGHVIGVGYDGIEAGPGEIALLAEASYLIHAEGEDANAVYLTTGATYTFGDFGLSAVYGLRDFNEGGSTDQLGTATLEYEILDGLIGAVGYSYAREDSESAHTVGVLLAYEFGGGFAFGN